MEYRRFGQNLVIRMDKGEEIQQQLQIVAEKEGIKLANVSALGAVNDFTVGAFDVERQEFHKNRFQGAYEIVSLVGTITTKDGAYYAHLHMSAGDVDGNVRGGHLNEAIISATCEMVVTVLEGRVERRLDPEVGLNLFRFAD